MVEPTPDLDGFAAAQHRLRERFGEPVEFVHTANITFPPGTPVDPETGEPYDPTIQPAASAVVSASANMNVAWRAQDPPTEGGAAGIFERDHVMLIGDFAASAAASGAVDFRLRGETFKIEAQKPDGVGAGDQRWLVYGRRKQ